MVSISQLNPLASVGIGDVGMVLLIFFLAILFLGLIGAGIWFWIQKKKLKYTIPLYKRVGNKTIRIAIYKARDFKIGLAGDKLWYVPKAKKYIAVGTLQTAPNEYSYFERSDGEWINIEMPDIDEQMKQAKVKYVNSDMRSERIAIGNILESRFKDKKSWWEKYGHLVTHVIFYLVVAVAMVVIFYQWGNIIDRTNELLAKIIELKDLNTPETTGVVPAMLFPIIWRIKRWKQ